MVLSRFILVFLLVLFAKGFSQESSQEDFPEDFTIDLRNPVYSEGVLTTEEGGIVTGPRLRIQARHIKYTKKKNDKEILFTLEAEGDLLIEFGDYIFVGERLYYDLKNHQGTLFQGKTAVLPWYFGGDEIELRSDGSYVVRNGFVTTSERDEPEWALSAKNIELSDQKYLTAQGIYLRFGDIPFLYVPSLHTNLNSIYDYPIRYRFRWGGKQGPRFGLTYEFLSWENLKLFLRFDYRITRGPGGGIEIRYSCEARKIQFQSINYVANDSSVFNLREKLRYRFEGFYEQYLNEDRTRIQLSWDKISDIDMPTSYVDKDFYYATTKPTEFEIRHQERDWISHFYVHVRVNNFQTIKQELPTFRLNVRPLSLGQTGIICEHTAEVSFLDFKYANNLPDVDDYHSARLEYRPFFYRPFTFGHVTFTPQLGGGLIFYGNSPNGESQWLSIATTGADLQTQLYRFYGPTKHIAIPYLSYRYCAAPTVKPNEHYIFDISDGLYRLNYFTFGCRNNLYQKRDSSQKQLLFADFYAHAFLNTNTIHQTIPKAYARIIYFASSSIKHTFDSAWNIEHHQLDYFNYRLDLTLNADFAVSGEYRHRDAWDWRKVDQDNFFLDTYRSEEQLRHSPLSDRRDTLLFHCFYRFHPSWAIEFASRQGWNRKSQPNYTEYEINVMTTIQTAWNLTFSYQHTQNDDRIAVFMNVGLRKPHLPLSCE